jgi:hypothetical protein
MEASEILQKAWTAVQDAGLPADLHEVAFREAVRLLSMQQPTPVSATAGAAANANGTGTGTGTGTGRGDGSGAQSGDSAATQVTEDQMYNEVVAGTGVDRNKLERLVHLDDGGPRLSLPGLKLGKNTADKARAVAQVLTIVRGFGLHEDATPLEVIRTECSRLKVYDQPNFSRQVTNIDGFAAVGTGQSRRLRAKAPAVAAFSDLVDKLLGESA